MGDSIPFGVFDPEVGVEGAVPPKELSKLPRSLHSEFLKYCYHLDCGIVMPNSSPTSGSTSREMASKPSCPLPTIYILESSVAMRLEKR
jgi:hypothetical protein